MLKNSKYVINTNSYTCIRISVNQVNLLIRQFLAEA